MGAEELAKQLSEASGLDWTPMQYSTALLGADDPTFCELEDHALWSVSHHAGEYKAERSSSDENSEDVLTAYAYANSPGAAVDVLSQRLGVSPHDDVCDDEEGDDA